MVANMSSKRQIRRRAEKKAKKELARQTKKAVSELANMPTECAICTKKIDIRSDFDLDNWCVRVTAGEVSMFCENCKAKGEWN